MRCGLAVLLAESSRVGVSHLLFLNSHEGGRRRVAAVAAAAAVVAAAAAAVGLLVGGRGPHGVGPEEVERHGHQRPHHGHEQHVVAADGLAGTGQVAILQKKCVKFLCVRSRGNPAVLGHISNEDLERREASITERCRISRAKGKSAA